jgi:hypothetical protein
MDVYLVVRGRLPHVEVLGGGFDAVRDLVRLSCQLGQLLLNRDAAGAKYM